VTFSFHVFKKPQSLFFAQNSARSFALTAALVTALSFLFLAPVTVAARTAGDVYDVPEAVAIQGRKYQMDQTIRIGTGYMPIDSFNRGYPLSGAYRYQLTPYLTWEVLEYTQVINTETKTKRSLQNLGINVENVGLGGKLDFPKQIYMTGINYSPMYSKNLLFNSRLFYSETNLYLGLGAVIFNSVGSKPAIAPGLEWRLYLSPRVAMNLFVKDFFYLDNSIGINGILSFGLGFEFRFHLIGDSVDSSKPKP
jgi:outer membrane beta-barrel protein